MNPVTVRSPNAAASFEFLSQHLNVPFGHDFMAAKTLLAIIEAAAPRMNEVDQVQLGRLMVATGHAIALGCRGTRA
jgi:hypothetical protein